MVHIHFRLHILAVVALSSLSGLAVSITASAEAKTFTYAYGGATLTEDGLCNAMGAALIDCKVTLNAEENKAESVTCSPLKAVGDNEDSNEWFSAMVERLEGDKVLKKDDELKRTKGVFGGKTVTTYCADTFGDPDIMDKEAECHVADMGRLSWDYHPTADDGPERHALRLIAVSDEDPTATTKEATERWSTWLKAWTQAQADADFKAYSALYADAFLAEGAKKPLKKKAWLKTQKARLKTPMTISIERLEVREIGGLVHLLIRASHKGGVELSQTTTLLTVQTGESPTIISEHQLVSAPGSETHTFAYGGYVLGGDDEEEPQIGVSFVQCKVGGANGSTRPASCSEFQTVGMGYEGFMLTDALQGNPSAKLLKKDRSLKKAKVNMMGTTQKAFCSKPSSGGGGGDQGAQTLCFVPDLGLIQSKGYYDGGSYEEHIVRRIHPGATTASDTERERWKTWLESWLNAQNMGEFKTFSAFYAPDMVGVDHPRGKAKTLKRKAWLKTKKRNGAFLETNFTDALASNLNVTVHDDKVYLLFAQNHTTGEIGSVNTLGPTLLIVSNTETPKILFEEMLLSFTR